MTVREGMFPTKWSLGLEREGNRGGERSGLGEGDKVSCGEGEGDRLVQLNCHLLILFVHHRVLPQADLGTSNLTCGTWTVALVLYLANTKRKPIIISPYLQKLAPNVGDIATDQILRTPHHLWCRR